MNMRSGVFVRFPVAIPQWLQYDSKSSSGSCRQQKRPSQARET